MKRPTPPGRIIKEGHTFTKLQIVAIPVAMAMIIVLGSILIEVIWSTPLAEISRGPATIATDILGTHLGCVMESEEPEVRALMTEIMHEFSLDNWTFEMGARLSKLSVEALKASGCLNEN